jgi:hypothetical protein
MPRMLELSNTAAPARRRALAHEIPRPSVADVLCLLGWLVLFCVAYQSLQAGLHVRRWAWDQSDPWRFQGDIRNAYSKGQMALDPSNGYLNLYTRFRQQPRPGTGFNLDYSPLRLLIVTEWVAWTRQQFPHVEDWQDTYAFNAPLLELNAALAAVGAVGMWLVVALWTRRSATPAIPRLTGGENGRWHDPYMSFWTDRGVLAAAAVGLIAAQLFWFNPALIWDAHVWPQWDIWPLPFYIFAIFAASVDAWWTAGLLLAIAALLKGQTLMVAPVMLLCPLFAGKPWKACRCAVGLAFGLLGFAAPWLLRTQNDKVWELSYFSVAWVASAVLAAALIHPRLIYARQRLATRLSSSKSLRGAAAAIAAALLAWPFLFYKGPANWWALGAIAALFALVTAFPPRYSPTWGFWLTTALVAALAICPWFGGSMDWWNVGFERGTVQYMNMHNGNTLNLAAILERNGWHSPNDDAWLFNGQMLSLRTVLIWAYSISLVACAAGAAMHYRRRDSRVLISLVTPWILMYALLPQIHDRYLNFAAGLTAVAPAVGVGLTLVHLIITGLALASTVMSVNGANPPAVQRFLGAMNPDAAWMTLTCTAIFFWVAIAPHRRRARITRPPDIAPADR